MTDNAPQEPVHHRDPGGFETTHWSLVLAAGRGQTAEGHLALEKLCQTYWPPLYAYVRRRVTNLDEAHDLTQAFFERLLDKGYLSEADPERGRFRAFLLTAFKHFLAKEWDKQRAQKRGGGRPALSFDFLSVDATDLATALTPDQIFEREWAVTLLGRVMQRLQRDMERDGKSQQFQLLRDMISGESPSVTYAEVAVELGISETAARMAASRLRSRYRELLRDEISQTLSSRDDVESEIRHLFQAFETH